MYAGLTHANNDTLKIEYNTYKDACLINIPLSRISIDWRNKSRDARMNGIYCWRFAIKWKTNQMATTEIGSILPSPLPSQLLHRISRLIKIDDIFADETSTSLDDSEPDNGNVCFHSKYLFKGGKHSYFIWYLQDSQLKDVKICVEPRLNPEPLHEVKTNWIERYCQSDRKQRVIWDSILYKEARAFKNKSMYEKVEVLMDIVSFFCFL